MSERPDTGETNAPRTSDRLRDLATLVSDTAAAAITVALAAGAVSMFLYFLSIGYLPDMDAGQLTSVFLAGFGSQSLLLTTLIALPLMVGTLWREIMLQRRVGREAGAPGRRKRAGYAGAWIAMCALAIATAIYWEPSFMEPDVSIPVAGLAVGLCAMIFGWATDHDPAGDGEGKFLRALCIGGAATLSYLVLALAWAIWGRLVLDAGNTRWPFGETGVLVTVAAILIVLSIAFAMLGSGEGRESRTGRALVPRRFQGYFFISIAALALLFQLTGLGGFGRLAARSLSLGGFGAEVHVVESAFRLRFGDGRTCEKSVHDGYCVEGDAVMEWARGSEYLVSVPVTEAIPDADAPDRLRRRFDADDVEYLRK